MSYRMIKICLALAAVLAVVPAFAQSDLSTPWSPSARSAARLIAAGGLQGGAYHAGVEIKLNPKTVTYWRNPGEAGAPPVFSFAQSQNVAQANVRYPVPHRIAEADGVEAFGYEASVVFPVLVVPVDAAKPVVLDLALNYAACERICVPAEAKLKLDLQPQMPGGEFFEIIAAAERLVPQRSPASDGLLVPVMDAGKPSWRVSSAALAEIAASDVFAEAPEGWYFDTQHDADGLLVTLVERPREGADARIPLVLTLAGAKGAREIHTALDVAAAKP